MEFDQWVGTHSCVWPSLTYKEVLGEHKTSIRVQLDFHFHPSLIQIPLVMTLMRTLPLDVTYFPRHGSLHIQFLRKQRLELVFTQVEFNVYSPQVS